jgi:demethylmenaquinone methyltransferase/2-methoxy-6-polyprenyl-1,4-benzoquinol methylase
LKAASELKSALGAKPAGAEDESSAAQMVRQMFNSIAPRYDLLNHVLSANVDRLWWRRAARRFQSVLAEPDAAVLDICCGTGDMTMALLRHRPSGARPIIAADFAREMLRRGEKKFGLHRDGRLLDGGPYAVAVEADALHLPLRAESLDLIVTAFGFRNLANYEVGLGEFYRVLRPGGQLGILDFSEPGGLIGKAYAVYFRHVLPAIGRAICGKDGPYNYLPSSVGSFPAPPAMQALMESSGFGGCAWEAYTFGIAGLYSATKPLVVG